jgi:hypothetical protein
MPIFTGPDEVEAELAVPQAAVIERRPAATTAIKGFLVMYHL